MAPLLTGAGRAASLGARKGLPQQPTPHAMAREGSPRPSLPPQPRHMCFQCGWELQGFGVLRKQHQIPFRSSNGPQQPSRGRAGGGDARTLQDRAAAGGIPDYTEGSRPGKSMAFPGTGPGPGSGTVSSQAAPWLSQAGPSSPWDCPHHLARCSPTSITPQSRSPAAGPAAGMLLPQALPGTPVTKGWSGWGR